MVASVVFIEQTGDDTERLEALRQFGRTLPNGDLYERHADAILAALRARVERHANGCWTWKGEPYETVGKKRMKLDPRLLIWVACAEAKPRHDLTLWPTCSSKECIRPEHQVEVVSLSSTVVGLTMWSDEGNEQFVRAALSKGDLQRVESPHFPRAIAFLPDEWERWLKRPDLEDYLLELMPLVPPAWQPELYQRRLRAIRGEDAEQIERMLLFCAHMGLGKVSGEAATSGLTAFWQHIRFRNNASFSACWWWSGDHGAPLYIARQGDPQLLVDPAALAWTLMRGALPPAPPGQIRCYCKSPDCVNPDHRSEVLLVSDAALLFPAGLDETIRRAGVAFLERAIKEGRLSSMLVGDQWAVRLQDAPTVSTTGRAGATRGA